MRGKWGEGELTFRQWHHAYLGFILQIISVLVDSRILYTIGTIILWDDLLQHYVQWQWDSTFQSALKYIYDKLYSKF